MHPSRRDLDEQDFVAGAGFGMTGPRPPRDYHTQDLVAAEIAAEEADDASMARRDSGL
jgi:hypothetical protein